ncbi:MAG: 3-hydroxyacyl-ACP dehydratase FabZ [Gammaproteobacteria bacterium]
MNIDDIMRLLPHRQPFLLVDKVLTMEKGKSITAVKNITIGEPFFAGHFPQKPIMPGVLMIEALAQTCGLLGLASFRGGVIGENDLTVLTGVDNCRFRRQVRPGDVLMMHAELLRRRGGMLRFSARAEVDGECAAEAVLTSFFQPPQESGKGQ